MPSPQPKKTIIYALGSNGSGQLGLAHKDDVARPQKCRFVSPAESSENSTYTDYLLLQDGEKLKKIVGGGNHTLLLTTHGRVFGAGLQLATHILHEDYFRKLELGFIEIDRTKFAKAGTETMDFGYFLRKPVLHTIRQEQTENDSQANKGHVDRDEEFKVTDIAATWEASFFVVNNQKIYCCGASDRGELGRGDVHEFLATDPAYWLIFDLRLIEGQNAKIERISSCMSHIVVLTSSGKLYGWGSSRKGQLGANLQKEKAVWEPMRIIVDDVLSSRIKQVVTGRDFTFIMGSFGNDYALLGAAPKGGFDFPIDFCDIVPDFTDDETLKSTASDLLGFHALWGSVVVRIPDGGIEGFGRNDHGQLGDDEWLYPGGIEKLATGSEHCVALAGNGSVHVWGWGEHGNCGEVSIADGHGQGVPTVFSPARGGPFMGVGAGCATTFFWLEE